MIFFQSIACCNTFTTVLRLALPLHEKLEVRSVVSEWQILCAPVLPPVQGELARPLGTFWVAVLCSITTTPY